jgi:transposase InsO family protein
VCRTTIQRTLAEHGVEPAPERGRRTRVHSVQLPARSPNLNAYAERFVRSIKEECLNQMVLLGERHLRTTVCQYVEHYHLERNHQGLGNALVEAPEPHAITASPVLRRKRLGGMLSYYYREAA